MPAPHLRPIDSQAWAGLSPRCQHPSTPCCYSCSKQANTLPFQSTPAALMTAAGWRPQANQRIMHDAAALLSPLVRLLPRPPSAPTPSPCYTAHLTYMRPTDQDPWRPSEHALCAAGAKQAGSPHLVAERQAGVVCDPYRILRSSPQKAGSSQVPGHGCCHSVHGAQQHIHTPIQVLHMLLPAPTGQAAGWARGQA